MGDEDLVWCIDRIESQLAIQKLASRDALTLFTDDVNCGRGHFMRREEHWQWSGRTGSRRSKLPHRSTTWAPFWSRGDASLPAQLSSAP